MEGKTVTCSTSNNVEGFLIRVDDDSMVWISRGISSSSDSPLSGDEKVIVVLCEHILSLEKEGEL